MASPSFHRRATLAASESTARARTGSPRLKVRFLLDENESPRLKAALLRYNPTIRPTSSKPNAPSINERCLARCVVPSATRDASVWADRYRVTNGRKR
jgi:hypothetical protein